MFIHHPFEQHLIDLTYVFKILRKFKLKMNIEKCHFCVFEVEALGHKISNKGLLPLEKKVDAIEKMDSLNLSKSLVHSGDKVA